MRKLFIAIGITLMLAAVTISAGAVKDIENKAPDVPKAGDVWDGNIREPQSLVIINEVYYYEIGTCAELAFVAQTGGDWLSRNYILTNNLILNNTTITWDKNGICTNSDTLRTWVQVDGFSGVFDGNGYTISGVYGAGGLFGEAKNSTLRNITLVNSYINGSGYYVGGIIDKALITEINNCTFSGCVRDTGNCVGGIVGYGNYLTDLLNCTNYGDISGETLTGGIAGSCNDLTNCINYGTVCGADKAGGIAGSASDIKSCVNYGAVSGDNYIGGIAGELYSADGCTNHGCISGGSYISGIGSRDFETSIMSETEFSDCVNTGNIAGTGNYVGGITTLLYGTIDKCCSTGDIYGADYCGGLTGMSTIKSGWTEAWIRNSYNMGSIAGNSFCGGIAGYINETAIRNCYSVGNVSGTSNIGAIAVNKQQLMFGPSSVSNIYYLKTDQVNSAIFGCEDVPEDIRNISAKTELELQKQETFETWNFSNIWEIKEGRNNGYPYLIGQNAEAAPLAGIKLNQVSLTMKTGDITYLVATPTPYTANTGSLKWSSSDESVLTIDQHGRIVAAGAGEAVVTVSTTDNLFQATCTVSVLAREKSEYVLTALFIRDAAGIPVKKIPKTDFWAAVSIKNNSSVGNSMVLFAAYDADGRYVGMNAAWIEDVPIGSTVNVSFLLSNVDGKIAGVKAFCVASFSDLTPLGSCLFFPQDLN